MGRVDQGEILLKGDTRGSEKELSKRGVSTEGWAVRCQHTEKGKGDLFIAIRVASNVVRFGRC